MSGIAPYRSCVHSVAAYGEPLERRSDLFEPIGLTLDTVSPGEVHGIVVGHLGLVAVLLNEHLLGEVDGDRPGRLHQRRSDLGIAEDQHGGGGSVRSTQAAFFA